MNAKTVAFLLIALTLLVIALSVGGAMYYMLFWMLMMMLLVSLETALATLWSIRVSTSAQRTRAVRGETVAIRVKIRRGTLLPIGAVELEVSTPADERSAGKIAVNLPPRREREYRYAVVCPHRGHYDMGVTRVRVTDIFGLFTFGRKIDGGNVSVTVLPKTFPVESIPIEPGDMGPQGRVRTSEDISSPSGVRQWQEGDHLRKVHWKLTMRKQELMVRTYEESARPDTLILLDASPINAPRAQVPSIEDALCEAAASAALAQMNAGFPVRMPLSSAQPVEAYGQAPAEIGRFLETLTDLRFDSPYSFEQVLILSTRRLQRTGGLVLVTPRLNTAIAHHAMRMHKMGVCVQLCWVAGSVSSETMTLKAQLELNGIAVRQISPWG